MLGELAQSNSHHSDAMPRREVAFIQINDWVQNCFWYFCLQFWNFDFFLVFVPGVICMVFCRFVAWFLRKKLMIFHGICYILVLWFSFCMVSATFCYLFRPKTCEFSSGICMYLLHLGALGCNFARFGILILIFKNGICHIHFKLSSCTVFAAFRYS